MISSNGNGSKKTIIGQKDIVKTIPVGDDEVTVLHGISRGIFGGQMPNNLPA